MGHERVGTLPRTKRWRSVVADIAATPSGDVTIASIAEKTLENVRTQFQSAQRDPAVQAAFAFLVGLAVSSRTPESQQHLLQLGIDPTKKVSPLSVAKALRQYALVAGSNPEYGDIAANAAIDAIGTWYQAHKSPEIGLFDCGDESYRIWHQAANGSGFCELARSFFANFTERYLSYFLEREASRVIPTLQDREHFKSQLDAHVDAVSQHAFETSKITQSFAAGWFNRNAATAQPTDEQISGFVSYAFGKLRDELAREGIER